MHNGTASFGRETLATGKSLRTVGWGKSGSTENRAGKESPKRGKPEKTNLYIQLLKQERATDVCADIGRCSNYNKLWTREKAGIGGGC